jgi:bifunctional non-homologous end joining protein LigD
MARSTVVEVDGRTVRLSNLDKVLYPAAGSGESPGFLKAQVIDYYARIAPVLLPHLRGRPVSLKRFPDGVTGTSFYEKNCPSHRPSWVRTELVAPAGDSKPIRYCVVEDTATLIWLANLAALELHAFQHTADQPNRPTTMAFDLDPGQGVGIRQCAQMAMELRQMLEQLRLKCLVKTSGGKGLHLYVPLNSGHSYDQTRAFARGIAQVMTQRHPQQVLLNMRKSLRGGKVLIDWSQNSSHKTTVCVYSLRAQAQPRVSMPLTWGEVGAMAEGGPEPDMSPAAVLARVQQHGDLFAPALEVKQSVGNRPAAAWGGSKP